ncbi:aminotransferase class III-fold pyridoxal phosphate-dependent enzyme, partial [Candidatus Bathyarchaeota archaeon]|nr:aminotransferase class III-fold pyridoxal phosphate-dependent enzyme [Candidatus Bathyarchaeota archaeon]
MKLTKSKRLYTEGIRYVPGGSSSFARVGRWFDPFNIVMEKGQGSKIWDVDGNEYIDFLIGYGALILGHRHPKI